MNSEGTVENQRYWSVAAGLAAFAISLPVFVGQAAVTYEESQQLRSRMVQEDAGAPRAEQLREVWSSNPTATTHLRRFVANESVDMLRSVEDGDWKYLDLLVDLDDHSFVNEKRIQCADLYAMDIKGSCSYAIAMVLTRIDSEHGKIDFIETTLRDVSAIGAEPSDLNCGDYVMCIGGIRLGEIVRIPDDKDEYAVTQELFSPWADPRLYDSEFVGRLIESYDVHAASFGNPPVFDDPSQALTYWSSFHLAEYMAVHQRRLREAESDE